MLVFFLILQPQFLVNLMQKSRKEEIIWTAAILFREKGYKATSMRELAEKVGMEAASLYNHIASKEAILQEICEKIANDYLSHLQQIENKESDFSEKIQEFIRLHIEVTIHNLSFVSVANHEWKHLSEPYLTHFVEMRKKYENGFLQILNAGTKAGEFRAVHPTIALFTLLSAIRWVEVWYKEDRDISIAELETEIIHLLLNGLKIK